MFILFFLISQISIIKKIETFYVLTFKDQLLNQIQGHVEDYLIQKKNSLVLCHALLSHIISECFKKE